MSDPDQEIAIGCSGIGCIVGGLLGTAGVIVGGALAIVVIRLIGGGC